jgi:hypothetical protein
LLWHRARGLGSWRSPTPERHGTADGNGPDPNVGRGCGGRPHLRPSSETTSGASGVSRVPSPSNALASVRPLAGGSSKVGPAPAIRSPETTEGVAGDEGEAAAITVGPGVGAGAAVGARPKPATRPSRSPNRPTIGAMGGSAIDLPLITGLTRPTRVSYASGYASGRSSIFGPSAGAQPSETGHRSLAFRSPIPP